MPPPRPHVSYDAAPDRPDALVLVLHGGRETSTAVTQAGQLAVLRMIPIGRRIASVGGGRLAVARLRFAVRGWNGRDQSPVADARWALDLLTTRYPNLPIGLVGHSMGGRTALRVGGYPGVRSVVGLAPWLPPGEPIDQLAGRQVLLVHGTADRMTSPRGSAAFAAALARSGTAAGLVEVTGGTHAMLRRPRLWHDLTARFLTRTLLGVGSGQSETASVANLLHRVFEGEARITV
jgi:pimeloyl-ACP methyl ester carboxylesterase